LEYITGMISAAVMVGEISAMFCASSSYGPRQLAFSARMAGIGETMGDILS
jgi:hypothetical protein